MPMHLRELYEGQDGGEFGIGAALDLVENKRAGLPALLYLAQLQTSHQSCQLHTHEPHETHETTSLEGTHTNRATR